VHVFLSAIHLKDRRNAYAPLRQRMLEDMQLRGLASRTQQSYLHAVQQLALHYGKSPELLTDEDLRQYFL
jgi:integrase/recombinase XerD